MSDYSELKRLAEAAPEGPWFGPEYAPGTSYVFDVDLGTLLAYESIDSEKDACLRYVAAANPAAVLGLIADNEMLTESRNEARGDRNKIGDRYDQLKAENDELIAALNEILRVTPMGVEAFGIAALVLGEMGVSKESSK
jgi:hypothetical protein